MEGGLWGKLNSLPLLCLITSIEAILGTCKRVGFEGHILQIYKYISAWPTRGYRDCIHHLSPFADILGI